MPASRFYLVVAARMSLARCVRIELYGDTTPGMASSPLSQSQL